MVTSWEDLCWEDQLGKDFFKFCHVSILCSKNSQFVFKLNANTLKSLLSFAKFGTVKLIMFAFSFYCQSPDTAPWRLVPTTTSTPCSHGWALWERVLYSNTHQDTTISSSWIN